MTDELKPCPCCNRPATLSHYEDCLGDHYQNACDRCCIETDNYSHKEELITEWNRRAEPIGNPDELPEWAINKIQEFRNSIQQLKYDDWKYRFIADSEVFTLVKSELDLYLGYVLSLRKPEERSKSDHRRSQQEIEIKLENLYKAINNPKTSIDAKHLLSAKIQIAEWVLQLDFHSIEIQSREIRNQEVK